MLTKKEFCLAVLQQFESKNPNISYKDKNCNAAYFFRDSKVAICYGYLNSLNPDEYPIYQEMFKSYSECKSRDSTLFGYTDKESGKFKEITFKEFFNMLPDD